MVFGFKPAHLPQQLPSTTLADVDSLKPLSLKLETLIRDIVGERSAAITSALLNVEF